MWADFKKAPRQHYYIKEVAQMSDGTFVIPMRWVRVVRDNNQTVDCADALKVIYDKAVSNLRDRRGLLSY